MRIRGFIWLEDVVEKIERKHRVTLEEAEAIFSVSPRFRFVEKGHREGEDVYAALGPTEAGRYLIVFFVLKKDSRVLPVSARDMTLTERRLYERK